MADADAPVSTPVLDQAAQAQANLLVWLVRVPAFFCFLGSVVLFTAFITGGDRGEFRCPGIIAAAGFFSFLGWLLLRLARVAGKVPLGSMERYQQLIREKVRLMRS